MSHPSLAVTVTDSQRDLWYVALAIGLVAAVAVAAMLAMLIRYLRDIETSADALLEGAGQVAENTAFIPQLEATTPVLDQIAAEGVVQDGYMNALSQGYAGEAEREDGA
jgi:hypothetical protein